MAGERDERAFQLSMAKAGGWNVGTEALGRLCFWLRRRYPTSADSRGGCAPILRWFRRETLLPGQPRSRTEPTLQAILQNLALGIVGNSANCDSVLRDKPLAILLAWMMWRAKDAFGPPPSSAAFRVPDAPPKLYTFLEAGNAPF